MDSPVRRNSLVLSLTHSHFYSLVIVHSLALPFANIEKNVLHVHLLGSVGSIGVVVAAMVAVRGDAAILPWQRANAVKRSL